MEQAQQLLEAFQQAENSTKRRACADQLHAHIDTLREEDQLTVRRLIKQYILAEAKQAIGRIEQTIAQDVNHA